MTNKKYPEHTPAERKPQLKVVLIQLYSQRAGDVWRGLNQIYQWLEEDPEDKDVYELLLHAVQRNHDLRHQVRNILFDMVQRGSKVAENAILALPSTVQDFLIDADDNYYAGEYERAVQLYHQVLKLDPENIRAKEYLAKAEIKRTAPESINELPRSALQLYRRARSHIAARDFLTAIRLINAAIESANENGKEYPDAERSLDEAQDLLIADEFWKKGKDIAEKGQYKEAISFYEKAIKLDPTNQLLRQEIAVQYKLENPEIEKYKMKLDRAVKAEQWGVALDLFNKLLILLPSMPYYDIKLNSTEIKNVLVGIEELVQVTVLLNSRSEQNDNSTEKDQKDRFQRIKELLDKAEENSVLRKSKLLRRNRNRYRQLVGKNAKSLFLAFFKEKLG